MNRSKRSQTQKIQKQMAKEVRNAQGRSPLPESRQYSDELTAKEMLKKFPKSEAKKKEESLSALEKKISIKKKQYGTLRSDALLQGGAGAGPESWRLVFPNQSSSYDATRRTVRFWGYDRSWK